MTETARVTESPGGDVTSDGPGSAQAGMRKAAALSVLSSFVSVIATIVRTKVTSVLLGPAGIGITAEITQLATLANIPASMAAGPALTRELSVARATGDTQRAERAYSTAFVLAAGCSLIGGFAALLAGRATLPAPWGAVYWPMTGLAAAAAFWTAIGAVPNQALVVGQRLGLLALLGTAAAAMGTLVVSLATYFDGLRGQFIAMAAAPILTAPLAFILGASALGLRRRPRFRFDWALVRDSAHVGLGTLVAGAALNIALYVIRVSLQAHEGESAVGQFQAAWAIGTTYFAAILSGLGNFAFPRYAAAHDSEALSREVDETLRFIFRNAPPLILVVIAFREDLIHLLYSHRFDPAIGLLGLLMIADVAKAVSWALAGPLLYRGHVTAFAALEALTIVGLGGGTALFVPHLGLAGVGIAAIFNAAIYSIAAAGVLKLACGVPLRLRAVLGTIGLTLCIALAYAAVNVGPIGKFLVTLAAVTWAARTGQFTRLAARFSAFSKRFRTRTDGAR